MKYIGVVVWNDPPHGGTAGVWVASDAWVFEAASEKDAWWAVEQRAAEQGKTHTILNTNLRALNENT